MSSEYWIGGFPATYSTGREKPWKQRLNQALSGKQYHENTIDLQFVFTKDNYEKRPYDIDNLCEPVSAVLTSSLRWFSGSRRNISLWTARKHIGKEQGLLIRDTNSSILTPSNMPLFNEVYGGALPTRATDDGLPLWIKNLGEFKVGKKCSVRLTFQNMPVNIADISTGNVKSIIDCLYPILGGGPKAPNDRIIEMLTVERVSSNDEMPGVRIAVWEGQG